MTSTLDSFAPFIDEQIGVEGGYSDPAATGNPDRGGVTIWGITEATARSAGYTGPMRTMSRAAAVSIYQAVFVAGPQFDLLGAIDMPLACKLVEIGIMSGPVTGGKMLQRALNVLNHNGKLWLYATLKLDGSVGAVSRAAVASLIASRGPDARRVLLGMVTAQHSVFLIQDAESTPSQEAFEYGWQLNRIVGGSIQQSGQGGVLASRVLAQISNQAATASALRSIT